MALHQIKIDYSIPETSVFELDIDDSLDYIEKEELARLEFKEIAPEVEDVNITGIKLI